MSRHKNLRDLLLKQRRFISRALGLAKFTNYPSMAKRAELPGTQIANIQFIARENKRPYDFKGRLRKTPIRSGIPQQRLGKQITARTYFNIVYLLENANLTESQVERRLALPRRSVYSNLKKSSQFYNFITNVPHYKYYKRRAKRIFGELARHENRLRKAGKQEPIKDSKAKEFTSLHVKALEQMREEDYRKQKKIFDEMLEKARTREPSPSKAKLRLRRLEHLAGLTGLEMPEDIRKRLEKQANKPAG